jgi:UDP-N-acetyl-alpha-D-muramoyl-L-alanyl-L-glutamate epimerase
MSYKEFTFSKYKYNNGILDLFYNVDDRFEFVETINFNPNNLVLRDLTDDEKKVLNIAFIYLHLVAGVSYYKFFLPHTINIKTVKLNKEQKKFFDILYFNGLGEFAYRNNLDLRKIINFPMSSDDTSSSYNITLQNNIIVPIGGGKDSVVSLEMVKKLSNQKIYTFSVNTADPIRKCCELSDCENILVTRKVSPLLIELNKHLEKYHGYNGHIPITSVIAFISVCTGIIYNCDTVVISNEKSSNIGNKIYNDIEINHQWSKSFEAEKMIHNFIQKNITTKFNYFSLLRPLSELQIVKLFLKIGKYSNVFSSCNKNFKIIKDKQFTRWCCDCDKCRFVFLIFASFTKKKEIIKIFSKNLLNDENQLNGYLELTGFSNFKPFECVGETEECIVAFYLLKDSEFKEDYIVKNILEKIKNKYSFNELKKLEAKYFTLDFKDTLLSEKFKNLYIDYVNEELK